LEGVSKNGFQIEMGIFLCFLFYLGIFLDLGAGLLRAFHCYAVLGTGFVGMVWSAGAAEVVIVLSLVGTLVAVIRSSNFYSFQTD
jgi:hypothetical protein